MEEPDTKGPGRKVVSLGEEREFLIRYVPGVRVPRRRGGGVAGPTAPDHRRREGRHTQFGQRLRVTQRRV